MFVTEAALIALREGLEAFLIVGILLGFVTKLGRPDARKWVWLGLALGIAASLLIGLLVQVFLLDAFENRGGAAWFELIAALVAVGVLTYMVFWMWKHTRSLMVGLRQRIGEALSKNTLGVIVLLTFASVVREGLEVVLFYGALAGRNAAFDLAWSGLGGAVVSIGIVVLILRTTVSFNLQKFFGITGALLIFVAAGLLVHSVHAATDLGLLAPGDALWDTSGTISDDGALGRVLHALFGYAATPTLLQAILYFGYLFGVGIPYVASLGAFRTPEKRLRKPAVAAALILIWVASIGTAFGAADPVPAAHDDHAGALSHAGPDHKALWADAIAAAQAYPGKIGILIRDHGEIITYNASTYEAVKEFVTHVWPYSGLPNELLQVDQGTWFIDQKHPFDPNARTDAVLVDARLKPWSLPAVPVNDQAESRLYCRAKPTDRFYFVSGSGPGLGEPDILELCGLAAYRDWLKMENYSPRHDQGMESWSYLETHLKKHYGDKVVVAFAHGHDVKANPNHTLASAARFLVGQGATVVLDSYQSSVFSDAMNTCMMKPHAEHALHAAGFQGKIIPVGQAGHSTLWGNATADYAEALVAAYPANARISIHLSQHGATPTSQNPCGGRPIGQNPPDAYHANLQKQYETVEPIVKERFEARGNVTVRHVYGQGAAKPEDGKTSPMEALAMDERDGVEQTIIIPYEFWGDAVDNLVYLRESLGFTPDRAPYYDANHQTRLTYHGIGVLVASAFFSTETKSDALLSQFAAAIESVQKQT